uniref:Protein cramped-like protein n=1 Tax=Ascaris suum TaxID=6253 RepID=F1KQE9_ASCSU
MSDEVAVASVASQQPTTSNSARIDTAPPNNATSGMSRRRLTFRPYSVAQAQANATSSAAPQSSALMTSDSSEVCVTSSTTLTTSTSSIAKTTRKWGQWNNSEIGLFYEGIKQYGKDFEQVARLMSRRKMNKDKEQIRNYYFNSYKLLKSTAPIDEELLGDVPRDARELFVVINGFEWKKRTGDAKFDPAKLRQLILEGSTSVRPKKKKQAVPIRTPACPALQKLFPSQKAEEPLPSHIFVYLSPRYEADRSYVESCAQNPLIRIRLAMTEHLCNIFKLLKMKWTHRLRKIDEELRTDEKDALSLTIYPDKTTRLGRLFVRYVEDSGPNAFCINRLRKELSQRCAEECDEHSNHSDAATTACSEGTHPDGVQVEVPNALYNESSSFVLNEVTLRAGLTEANVGDATATELFYLCGMEQKIYLQYSTNRSRNRAVEPWNIFVSLITRNYGENLCKILAEPETADEARQVMVTVEDRTRKRRISNSNESAALNTTQKLATTCGPKIAALVTADSSAAAGGGASANVCDQVVESENNAFMLQLESLQTKKRSKPYTQRAQSKRIGAHTAVSVANSVYDTPTHIAASYAPRYAQQSTAGPTACHLLPVQTYSMADEHSPTDFSHIITNANVANVPDGDRMMAGTPELGGYRPVVAATPTTRFAAEVLTSLTTQRQPTMVDQQCVGDPSNCEQREIYPKHASHPSGVQLHYVTEGPVHDVRGSDMRAQHSEDCNAYKQQTVHTTMDNSMMSVKQDEKTLTELSAVDLGVVVGSSLDMSPLKGSSNLPDDVRYSFEMMMQQNSVDYCRNFEQLLTSIDTPKKIP